MEEPQLELILTLLHLWWDGQETSDSLTQAQVILLYKKGVKNNLSNYRPISLLNTVYNILTTLLQQRLSEVLDTHLQQNTIWLQTKTKAQHKQSTTLEEL